MAIEWSGSLGYSRQSPLLHVYFGFLYEENDLLLRAIATILAFLGPPRSQKKR